MAESDGQHEPVNRWCVESGMVVRAATLRGAGHSSAIARLRAACTLPIARGKSMSTAHWARDLLAFYGQNIFMAETSATSGGLDSLLQPRGPIKKAQDAAARAFGARQTFFVTNGTSTANKIVSQALVRPGDIVLIDRECHKSHHYALVLAGAMPVYLDAYALPQYSMYGAVPLEDQGLRVLDHGPAL